MIRSENMVSPLQNMKIKYNQKNIPDGWTTTKLQEVALKISDGLHSTPKYTDKTDYFFINGNNLLNDSIFITSDTKSVHESEYLKHKKELNDETILMSINGTIGNVAYYKGEKVILGKSAAYINCSKNVSKRFIFALLKTSKIKKFYESELTGSTIQNLSLRSIKNTQFLLPPLLEQNRIVTILETWDRAIELLEKKIEIKRKIKKILMQQLLTGKIRLFGFKNKKWNNVNLGDVSEIILSNVDKHIKNGEKEVFLCNYMDVYYKDSIDSNLGLSKGTVGENELKKFVLRKGDVLITKDSETPEDIARSCVINKDFDNIVCGYHIAIIRGKKDLINGFFLKRYFDLPLTQNYFFRLANGATRFGLGKSSIEKALINLPSLEEQTAIANILNGVNEEITTFQKKLNILKEQKKYLLNNLITGAIRTPEDLRVN